MNLQEIRSKYPQYEDLSDKQLADGLHSKYYSDIPKSEYYEKIGFAQDLGDVKPVDYTQEMRKKGKEEGGLIDTLRSGLTLGLSEKVGALGAGVGNLLVGDDFSEGYDQGLARQRGAIEGAYDRNPILAPVTEIGSSMLFPMGAAKAAIGKIAPNLGATTAKIAESVLGGAGSGAITGFSKSDNGIEGATGGALMGAAVGGALPPALKLGGAALSAPVKAIMNRLGTGPSNESARMYAKYLADAGQSPEQIERLLEKLGPRGTIADASKGKAIAKARELAQQSEGMAQAERSMQYRGGTGGSAVMSELRDASGQVKKFIDEESDLIKQRAEIATPLYEKSNQKTGIYSDRLNSFVKSKDSQVGLRQAIESERRQALAENRPFNIKDYTVTDFNSAGDPVIGAVPNMRTLDLIKRGYDQMIEKEIDSVTGKVTQKGRDLIAVRNSYLEELDKLNPYFKAARDAWAGPTQTMEAMKEGRKFAKGDEQYTMRTIKNMGKTEKDFYKIGLIREIENMFNSPQNAATVAKRLKSIKSRPILKEVLGKDTYLSFMKSLDREMRFQKTSNFIRGGSDTFSKFLESTKQGVGLSDVATEAAMGNMVGAGTNAARGIIGKSMELLTGLPSSVKREMADAIFSRDPQVQKAFLNKMRERVKVGKISQDVLDEIVKRVTRTAIYSTNLGAN